MKRNGGRGGEGLVRVAEKNSGVLDKGRRVRFFLVNRLSGPQSIIRILAYYCHLRVPFFSVISHFRMHWIHFCFSREDDTFLNLYFMQMWGRGWRGECAALLASWFLYRRVIGFGIRIDSRVRKKKKKKFCSTFLFSLFENLYIFLRIYTLYNSEYWWIILRERVS